MYSCVPANGTWDCSDPNKTHKVGVWCDKQNKEGYGGCNWMVANLTRFLFWRQIEGAGEGGSSLFGTRYTRPVLRAMKQDCGMQSYIWWVEYSVVCWWWFHVYWINLGCFACSKWNLWPLPLDEGGWVAYEVWLGYTETMIHRYLKLGVPIQMCRDGERSKKMNGVRLYSREVTSRFDAHCVGPEDYNTEFIF